MPGTHADISELLLETRREVLFLASRFLETSAPPDLDQFLPNNVHSFNYDQDATFISAM